MIPAINDCRSRERSTIVALWFEEWSSQQQMHLLRYGKQILTKESEQEIEVEM